MYSIDDIRRKVAPVARDFGVGKLALFGSYARGEATGSSDVDMLIVDKGKLRGMFNLSGFQLAMQDTLGLPVDVVTLGGLYDDVRQNISGEEVMIYDSRNA
jgi:predicted nucleotidyltransferase